MKIWIKNEFFYFLQWWRDGRHLYRRCSECHRVDKILWLFVGKHPNCIPF